MTQCGCSGCGDRETEISGDRITGLLSRLSHRGPDDQGFYLEPAVGLGQRRLSIIDLAGGHQPMSNEDGSVWITFNGEIYNYQDLQPELERIYKKDERALARLFGLSLKFKRFNRNSRAYGQVIYSCYLRFTEIYGVDLYLKVLDRQSAVVQQRVRDFLYYPLLRVPKEKRKENQEEIYKMYPRLFPSDYKFGRNDPIF